MLSRPQVLHRTHPRQGAPDRKITGGKSPRRLRCADFRGFSKDLIKESEALLSVSCTRSVYEQAPSRIEIVSTTIDRLPSGIAARIRANFSWRACAI